MRFDDEGKKALNLLKARTACKLAEVRRLLAPDLEGPCTPDHLLAVAEERLATLPAHEQEKIRLRAVVAYAELEQLVSEMSRYVAELSIELHDVRARTKAVNAYRRAPRQSAYAFSPF